MKTKTEKKPLFVLCYRQGTPLRYKWNQTLLSASNYADLAKHAGEIEKAGHKAHIMPAIRLENGMAVPKHGLPESFGPEYKASDVMDSAWQGGWLADADSFFEWESGKVDA